VKEDDEDAKALTVLASGTASTIDLNGLGLKKIFTTYNAAMQAPTYSAPIFLSVKGSHVSVYISLIHIASAKTGIMIISVHAWEGLTQLS
jgi:hypothetical protein